MPRSLAAEVIRLLSAADQSVATAESLTGGQLAARITDIPGSSTAYLGGVVSYATAVKESVLGVPEDVVAGPGVVSAECAEAMADGVRKLVGSTFALSTTGVAGPEPQEGKPVGLVFVGVASPDEVTSIRLELDGDRGTIQRETCSRALEELAAMLRGEEPRVG